MRVGARLRLERAARGDEGTGDVVAVLVADVAAEDAVAVGEDEAAAVEAAQHRHRQLVRGDVTEDRVAANRVLAGRGLGGEVARGVGRDRERVVRRRDEDADAGHRVAEQVDGEAGKRADGGVDERRYRVRAADDEPRGVPWACRAGETGDGARPDADRARRGVGGERAVGAGVDDRAEGALDQDRHSFERGARGVDSGTGEDRVPVDEVDADTQLRCGHEQRLRRRSLVAAEPEAAHDVGADGRREHVRAVGGADRIGDVAVGPGRDDVDAGDPVAAGVEDVALHRGVALIEEVEGQARAAVQVEARVRRRPRVAGQEARGDVEADAGAGGSVEGVEPTARTHGLELADRDPNAVEGVAEIVEDGAADVAVDGEEEALRPRLRRGQPRQVDGSRRREAGDGAHPQGHGAERHAEAVGAVRAGGRRADGNAVLERGQHGTGEPDRGAADRCARARGLHGAAHARVAVHGHSRGRVDAGGEVRERQRRGARIAGAVGEVEEVRPGVDVHAERAVRGGDRVVVEPAAVLCGDADAGESDAERVAHEPGHERADVLEVAHVECARGIHGPARDVRRQLVALRDAGVHDDPPGRRGDLEAPVRVGHAARAVVAAVGRVAHLDGDARERGARRGVDRVTGDGPVPAVDDRRRKRRRRAGQRDDRRGQRRREAVALVPDDPVVGGRTGEREGAVGGAEGGGRVLDAAQVEQHAADSVIGVVDDAALHDPVGEDPVEGVAVDRAPVARARVAAGVVDLKLDGRRRRGPAGQRHRRREVVPVREVRGVRAGRVGLEALVDVQHVRALDDRVAREDDERTEARVAVAEPVAGVVAHGAVHDAIRLVEEVEAAVGLPRPDGHGERRAERVQRHRHRRHVVRDVVAVDAIGVVVRDVERVRAVRAARRRVGEGAVAARVDDDSCERAGVVGDVAGQLRVAREREGAEVDQAARFTGCGKTGDLVRRRFVVGDRQDEDAIRLSGGVGRRPADRERAEVVRLNREAAAGGERGVDRGVADRRPGLVADKAEELAEAADVEGDAGDAPGADERVLRIGPHVHRDGVDRDVVRADRE